MIIFQRCASTVLKWPGLKNGMNILAHISQFFDSKNSNIEYRPYYIKALFCAVGKEGTGDGWD